MTPFFLRVVLPRSLVAIVGAVAIACGSADDAGTTSAPIAKMAPPTASASSTAAPSAPSVIPRIQTPPQSFATSVILDAAVGDAGAADLPTGTQAEIVVASADRIAIHGLASGLRVSHVELRGDVSLVCVRVDDGGAEKESTLDFAFFAPDSTPERGIANAHTTNGIIDVGSFAKCLDGWSVKRIEGSVQAIATGGSDDDVTASGVLGFHTP